MQAVFVLLAVNLKEISDTKGRGRGAVASGLLKKRGDVYCFLWHYVTCLFVL